MLARKQKDVLRRGRHEATKKAFRRLHGEQQAFLLTQAEGRLMDEQYLAITCPPDSFNRSSLPYQLTSHLGCGDWRRLLSTMVLPVLLFGRIAPCAFAAVHAWLKALSKLVTLEFIADKTEMVVNILLTSL